MKTALSILVVALGLTSCQKQNDPENVKPRVVVSTDIGGTDPDDFQSMIHYLMYADRFQTEGLIASPYGEGQKESIFRVIDLYEKDFPKLSQHGNFPAPDELRKVVKQGAMDASNPQGFSQSTEGSNWIIKKAREESDQPLWVLVWGGLEDLTQALHDAPDIQDKLRVYWIGGPNKKWSVHAYLYLARNFPDLWMIEANSTYRGWIIDKEAKEEFKKDVFFERFIKGIGALGQDFGNHYGGEIKMGDTPSVAYLLNGEPTNPAGESWGGSFTKLPYSAFRPFARHTTIKDTIPAYSVIEWTFQMEQSYQPGDSATIWMKIAGQRIDGFFDASSNSFSVRFVPKKADDWSYKIHCTDKSLHGLTGEFVSVNPWPGEQHPENIPLRNWWSDLKEDSAYLEQYPGAKTISKWREDFLGDWSERMKWLE